MYVMQGLVAMRGGEIVEGWWQERAAAGKDEAFAKPSQNRNDLII